MGSKALENNLTARSVGIPSAVSLPTLIAEIGNNHLGDVARAREMLAETFKAGIDKLSKVPLRFVTFLGFAAAIFSLLTGLAYLAYKLIFWANFSVGIAPLVIGPFFLGSVHLLSMGIPGEYIGSIHTQGTE